MIYIKKNNNDFNINSYTYLDLYSCEAMPAFISSKSHVLSTLNLILL